MLSVRNVGRAAFRGAGSCRATAWYPNESSSPTGRSPRNSRRRSRRRGSARSSSIWSRGSSSRWRRCHSRPTRRPELRDEAQSRVHDVYDTYSRGEVLVEAGQTIGEEQLILLRLEHDAAMGELTFGDKARRALGILALVAALYFLAASYVVRREPRFVEDYRRVAMICGLIIAALAVNPPARRPDLECRDRSRSHRRR